MILAACEMGHVPLWVEEQFTDGRYWEHDTVAQIDPKQVEKLLAEAKVAVLEAQKVLVAVQPIIDKLDDLVPDTGPGEYLHMVRVALDLFENALGKVQSR